MVHLMTQDHLGNGLCSQPKPNQQPTDCNTDAVSARKYLDTIVGYFAPRACLALNLPCKSSVTSTKGLS